MNFKILIQIITNYRSKNLSELLKDFRNLIWVLNRLTHALYEGKAELKPWQEHLEYLLVKFSFNCCTVAQIAEGTKTITHKKNREIIYPDLHSLFVTCRLVIETYLTIYYLNFDSIDADQSNFRNLLYIYSGLSMRQKFQVLGEENRVKLEREKKQIEELKKQIISNTYFQKLENKRQKELLKRKHAKEFGWEDLIKKRGIKSEEFLSSWRLFSNYAHSEYLGILQFKDYLANRSELDRTIYTIIYQTLIVIVLQINDIKENFKSAEFVYNSLDGEIKDKIEIWIDIAKRKTMADSVKYYTK